MMRLDELHPAWVGHFLYAVRYQGWSESRITKKGRVSALPPKMKDVPRAPRESLLSSADGREAFVRALILADTATGASIGAGVLNSFFDGSPPSGVHFDQEVFFENDHRKFLRFVMLSHSFASEHLDAQLRSKES